ncbi:FadR/GntR family transcriptional regulator [Aeromicrobium wangtongii]|uniref:FadR family transcriptional regulator n=1 Tax=Aeromicrobium wangtongii TaxID=2969247 RepID=A0ABY5M8E6_9ACTN|nr:FadR/GntR family transcriptional regulator [Aeromicrobium wangtongii]MCD9198699.1 FadR family transcriptional regulator [Aeromicrobium wangtongii]UUP13255.1 FadR family transcriptional regulator [Aeromicrobium wangtongii]
MTEQVLAGAVGGDNLAVSRVLPAYQQVADQLLDLILSGSLSSGDRLPSEAELSGVFGVSRSTVREALRVLASRDLIHTLRGTTGGTFVSRVQFEQISEYLETSLGLLTGSSDVSVAEMLEAREVLEVPAARLAASRRDEAHLAALQEAIDRENVSQGRGIKFREHRNFHALVVEAAGNGLLGVMTGPVFQVLQAQFVSPDVTTDYWAQIDCDHRDILRCIESGDGDGAASAMKAHLVRLRTAYREPPD